MKKSIKIVFGLSVLFCLFGFAGCTNPSDANRDKIVHVINLKLNDNPTEIISFYLTGNNGARDA